MLFQTVTPETWGWTGGAPHGPVTFIYVGVRLREKRFLDEGVLGPDAVHALISRRATPCEVAPFDTTTDSGLRGWTDLLRALETHLKIADHRPACSPTTRASCTASPKATTSRR